ncbi:MAG: polysaccharide biosynthesis C-terminal domain-containing protein [Acidobacteria bacterium]|nr:polysaccharide biosynthesis C-terminal domain-containing protein [Acidobacteriota bacterium]
MTSDQIEVNPVAAQSSDRRSSGWDIRNAPGNYFWLILFQAGSALAAFGSVWLITRPQHLGKEGYGGIMAIIVASQVVLVFVNWTAISVVRFGVDEFIETAAVARTFWTRFLILSINLVAVLALSAWWFDPLARWLKLSPASFWLVIGYFVISAVWLHLQQGLQAAKMLRAQGFLLMAERMLTLAGIVALTIAGSLDFQSAVVCYVVAPGVVMIAGLSQLSSVIFRRFSFRKEDFKKILVYSLPLVPYGLVGYFSGSYLDAIFITSYLSTADLGVYSLAIQINGIAMQVPTLANTVLLPLLVTQQAESGKERSFGYFRNVLPGIVLMWGVASSAMGFVFYFAIPVIYGAPFSPAAVPVWILLSATVVWIPVAIGYSALANTISATYISLVAAIASSAVNVGANFILIPKYGMIGCAIATLIAFTASVVTFAILLKRSAKMPISWTFFAFIPSVVSVILLTLLDAPVWALMGCVAVSGIIAFVKRDSIKLLISFGLNFRRSA